LQHRDEGRATRAARKPDGYLVFRGWVVGWEEPEEQLARVGAVGVDTVFLRDGYEAGVRLA
jgi:hypothetical protein